MKCKFGSRRRRLSVAALVVSGAAIGCQTPGYRTEVYPGQEGQVQIKRVPDDTPPQHSAPPPEVVRNSSDANLNTIQSLWPRLSPEDRERVADMARRLAESQK